MPGNTQKNQGWKHRMFPFSYTGHCSKGQLGEMPKVKETEIEIGTEMGVKTHPLVY